MKRFFFLCWLLIGATGMQSQNREFTLLQWNIWQEGTMVPGGYEAIADEIARLKPDFVTLSEVRNYNGQNFCDRIVRTLKEHGEIYYSFYSKDSGLLSRHPIAESTTVYPENNDHGSIYRMVVNLGEHKIAVYTAHLDYLNDAYYNVRGYDGSTWEEISVPQSIHEVLEINDRSLRDDAIRAFLEVARKDIADGNIVLIGGDFNEPSHLDWIRETKDLYDHQGMIIPWTVTLLLDNHKFIDAYREKYPDVLDYPGFTFPSDNALVAAEKLTWAPKADERERIDYIFYHPHPELRLKDIAIFGPDRSIAYCKRVKESSKDRFLLPKGVWPTDHKGLLATFRLKKRVK